MNGRNMTEAFRRIAMMLMSLATLAERAGDAVLPVRCLVLWFLRHAESAASAYAADVAPFASIEPPEFDPGDTPDDADHLAYRLRALAAIFFLLSQEEAPEEYLLIEVQPRPRSSVSSGPRLCAEANRIRTALTAIWTGQARAPPRFA